MVSNNSAYNTCQVNGSVLIYVSLAALPTYSNRACYFQSDAIMPTASEAVGLNINRNGATISCLTSDKAWKCIIFGPGDIFTFRLYLIYPLLLLILLILIYPK